MKKLLAIAILACAISFASQAAEGKKKELTEEQQKTQKELLAKYDTNKDGKIDKDEASKMSADDKEKWTAIHPHKKKKADDSK